MDPLQLLVVHIAAFLLQLKAPLRVVQGNNLTSPHNEDREGARNITYTSEYCQVPEINSECGGAGWTRIAYLNKTDSADPGQSCPSPWTQNVVAFKRLCFRSYSLSPGCDSVIYSSMGVRYRQVCGRIVGYQYGNTWAFYYYSYSRSGYSIDTHYIDGISVTHGQSPRKHIWTFAAGWSEKPGISSCPCGSSNHCDRATVPPYVGSNYFCETAAGSNVYATYGYFNREDPLWDGKGCGPKYRCECTLNNPPWFTATLTNPTNDNIEVRICSNDRTRRMNVGIELIELYIR